MPAVPTRAVRTPYSASIRADFRKRFCKFISSELRKDSDKDRWLRLSWPTRTVECDLVPYFLSHPHVQHNQVRNSPRHRFLLQSQSCLSLLADVPATCELHSNLTRTYISFEAGEQPIIILNTNQGSISVRVFLQQVHAGSPQRTCVHL